MASYWRHTPVQNKGTRNIYVDLQISRNKSVLFTSLLPRCWKSIKRYFSLPKLQCSLLYRDFSRPFFPQSKKAKNSSDNSLIFQQNYYESYFEKVSPHGAYLKLVSEQYLPPAYDLSFPHNQQSHETSVL